MKQSHGFTLVELMVTIAVLAILLAIGIPNFQRFIQNAQIRTSAENVQAGLSLARSEALRRNARVSFWMVTNTTNSCALSASGTSWVVSQDSPAGNCAATASDSAAPRLIQSRSGSDNSQNVALSATDSAAGGAAVSCVTFNGFGQMQSACNGGNPIARIQFTATNGKTLEVRATSGGATRMCDPSVSDNTSPAKC